MEKEKSYAVKVAMVQRQIQLRKQLDRLKKIDDIPLTNRDGKGEDKDKQLELLLQDFERILQHEEAFGIPTPTPPLVSEFHTTAPLPPPFPSSHYEHCLYRKTK